MLKIKLYDYDDRYDFLADMMIKDNLVHVVIIEQMPQNEEEIDTILKVLGEHEGYLYEIINDDYMFSTGINTSDSIYEDIIELLKTGGYLNESIAF